MYQTRSSSGSATLSIVDQRQRRHLEQAIGVVRLQIGQTQTIALASAKGLLDPPAQPIKLRDLSRGCQIGRRQGGEQPAEILAAVDAAQASIDRGEGIPITRQSMRALAEDVKRRGRARLAAERETTTR